jgi:DNA polymerase III subunit delta'
VIAVRVPLVSDADVKAFLSDPAVSTSLGKERGASAAERVRAAGGAPGRLFSGESSARATIAARRIIDAAVGDKRWQRYAAALGQGAASARGAFADTLDALLELLGERTRDSLHRKDDAAAAAASKSVEAVLRAQTRATGNVSPQLITAKLIRELSATLR